MDCGCEDRNDVLLKLEECEKERRAAQEEAHIKHEKQIQEISTLEESVTSELKERYMEEDSRLQAALEDLRKAISREKEPNKVTTGLKKAKAELVVAQSYELKVSRTEGENDKDEDLSERIELTAKKSVALEWLELGNPRDLRVVDVSGGKASVGFNFLSQEEERVLTKSSVEVNYKALLQKKTKNENYDKGKEYALITKKEEMLTAFSLFQIPLRLRQATL